MTLADGSQAAAKVSARSFVGREAIAYKATGVGEAGKARKPRSRQKAKIGYKSYHTLATATGKTSRLTPELGDLEVLWPKVERNKPGVGSMA